MNQRISSLFAGALAAFTTSAQPTWIAEIKGSGWDLIHDMALDANGNAVVCGRFEGTTDFDPTSGVFNLTSAGSFDGFVAKYDVNGDLLWAERMGGTDGELLQSRTIDVAGNIALYGWFEGTADIDPTSGVQSTASAGWRDGCVIKLDANGNLLWAFALDNTTQCYGGDVDFSPLNGDVIVTGYYETSIDLDPNGSYVLNVDMDGIVEENTHFLARYDNGGNLIWANKLAGNEATHVDVFASGGNEVINWCMAGIDQSTSPSDLDPGSGFVHPVAGSNGSPMHYIALAQFDASGTYLWSDVTAVYYSAAGANPPDPDLWDLTTDTTGNIHLVGSIHQDYSTYAPNQAGISHLGLTRDGFVLKYNSAGTLLWEKMVGGPDLDDEAVTDVSIDANGDVWIVTALRSNADVNLGGSSVNVGILQETDIVVVRYDANGNHLWHGIVGGDWYDSGVRLGFWNGDAVLAGSYATFSGTADLDITSGTTALVADGLYDGFITRFSTSISTGMGASGPTESSAITVFPNPAHDRITMTGLPILTIVDVFNAIGQPVISTRDRTIDVSGWNEGVYTAKVEGRTLRMIVRH